MMIGRFPAGGPRRASARSRAVGSPLAAGVVCPLLTVCLALVFSLPVAAVPLSTSRGDPDAGSDSGAAARTLTLVDRLAAQQAIEQVYWEHRIWPAGNPAPKPSLDEVVTADQIRARVEDYLDRSAALEQLRHRPITPAQLQAEMDRMARESRDPEMLRELFAALGDDPFLIAECLARPALAVRLTRSAGEGMVVPGRTVVSEGSLAGDVFPSRAASYRLPRLASASWPTCASDTWTASSTPALPDGRAGHTAVWTGAEMIVWGGYNHGELSDDPSLNTGGRYDPATDTWRLTSTGPGVSEPRAGHVAVWTGTEMIVWSGIGYDGTLHFETDTGSRYDPASDTWRPISSTGAPLARTGAVAVWTGSRMVVWGGVYFEGPTPVYLGSGGRYDPSTDTWAPTSEGPGAPSPRGGATAVWTGNRMVVWGGLTDDGLGNRSYLNTGGRYDPVTDTWSPTGLGPNVPTPRANHVAVWTGSAMIAVCGEDPDGFPAGGGRYDPVLDAWSPVSSVYAPSSHSCGGQWTGTELIVWCGPAGNGGWGARYDPAGDVWTPITTSLPQEIGDGFTTVWTGSEFIFWGGYEGNSTYDTGGRYSPTAGSWLPTGTGLYPREGHTALWTGAEMIVWGGLARGGYYDRTNTGARYTPATDDWAMTSLGPGVPEGRTLHTAVWTGTEMIVWGGEGGWYLLGDGARYNPMTHTWAPLGTTGAPSARKQHTALWTGKFMLVWGGSDGTSALSSGAVYSPKKNAWRPTATGAGTPSPRFGHTALWSGTEMIVWGGTDGLTFTSTGGRYNPLTGVWKTISTAAGSPSPRAGHTAVWTGNLMIVWGGTGPSGLLNTGGIWKASIDKWRATGTGTGLPAARTGHTAVWTGTEMLVWGGDGGTLYPGYFDDGARYQPLLAHWTPMASPAGAVSARAFHTAVATGDRMIVWGGLADPFDPQSYLNTGGAYCYAP